MTKLEDPKKFMFSLENLAWSDNIAGFTLK
jgi:hypothetical protein